jgi:hypothetical protein
MAGQDDPFRRHPAHPAPATNRLANQRRELPDRGQHVVESARPAAASLPYPPVLGNADGEPGGRERLGQRSGVGAVVGGPPEAAVQEQDQLSRTRSRRQPEVSRLVLGALAQSKVGQPGKPRQYIGWLHNYRMVGQDLAAVPGRAVARVGAVNERVNCKQKPFAANSAD